MPENKSALIIVGSSRTGATTSEAIADHMIEQLKLKNIHTNKSVLNQIFRTETGMNDLLKLIDDTDILIFSFPLYVDTLPYNVTRAYEMIYEHKKNTKGGKATRLFVTINSGFPEPKQSETAIHISKVFAHSSVISWAGAFAIGAGSAIAGRPLREMGKKTKNLVEALDLASAALAEGRDIPEDAFRLVSKGIPAWLYVIAANRVVHKEAAENNTLERMHERPYLR